MVLEVLRVKTDQPLCQQPLHLRSRKLWVQGSGVPGRGGACVTLTPLPLSSGVCRSSPSLQVYRQSITFLSVSFPERMVKPARLPRKNWVMRRSPPVGHEGGKAEIVGAAWGLPSHFSMWCYQWWWLDGWTCRLVPIRSC